MICFRDIFDNKSWPVMELHLLLQQNIESTPPNIVQPPQMFNFQSSFILSSAATIKPKTYHQQLFHCIFLDL